MGNEKLPTLGRLLRQNQTDAERRLWTRLRARRFQGIKFRRQQPVGSYIVDFCSLEEHLVIELDGGQHTQMRARDARRTAFLQKKGFKVIRVWDHEVFNNMEGVLEYIHQAHTTFPSPQPSPARGEGDHKKYGGVSGGAA